MRQSRAPLRINFSGENRVTTFSVCVSFTVRKFLLRFNQVPTTSASCKVLIHTSSSSARVWLQLPAARSGLPSSLTEQKHSSGQLNLFLRHTSFLHVDYFKEILSRFLFFLSLSVAISPVISVQACERSSPDKWYLQPNLSAVSPADSSLSEISSIYFLVLPYLTSKVPNSSVPSIKMSDFITHMIKIKASVSFCILSHVVPHLVGPGRDTALPEQN